MHLRRRASAKLRIALIFLALYPTDAAADVSAATLPLEVNWDVLTADLPFETEFIVSEHWLYEFIISFRYGDHRQGPENLRQLEKFTGDASYHRVTKESAETANPVEVPEYTKDELDFMATGGSLVGGNYFRNRPLNEKERWHEAPPNTVLTLTNSGAGVEIPVHIKISRADTANGSGVIVDKIVNTKGFESRSGGKLELNRLITKEELKEGTYRVVVSALKKTIAPPGVESALRIHSDPRMIGSLRRNE